MGRLYIRVDDFPGTKPEEFYKHNLENYRRFHDVLTTRGLLYTLGVIPRHVTDDQLAWLGENRVKVALHGIDHDERFPNEFRDHQTVAEVGNSLAGAKRRLEAFCGQVSDYIPPHNVVNVRTVHALLRCGFRTLHGGPGTEPAVAKIASELGLDVVLTYPPFEYGRSDELLERGSVDHVVGRLRDGDVWLALHWTWEQNIGLSNLERYLDTLDEKRGMMGRDDGQG